MKYSKCCKIISGGIIMFLLKYGHCGLRKYTPYTTTKRYINI